MERNNRSLRNENEGSEDNEQLRDDTTNETIRAVNGGPDMDLNNLKESNEEDDKKEVGGHAGETDISRGMGYTPNDASGVRSGGLTDMDDQAAGGAGFNTVAGKGSGSHLNTKKGVSGSDYDGQNATS